LLRDFTKNELQGYEADKILPHFFVACLYMNFAGHHPQFFTTTILEWKHLLKKITTTTLFLTACDFLLFILSFGRGIMPGQ
jgi:hypothetical protein